MITLNTPASQKRFRNEAVRRAHIHGKAVATITPVVIDAILRHADAGSVASHSYNGKMTGSGWASFKGKRVYTAFDRPSRSILVRQDTKGGKILLSFDNKTKPAAVERDIKRLRRLA